MTLVTKYEQVLYMTRDLSCNKVNVAQTKHSRQSRECRSVGVEPPDPRANVQPHCKEPSLYPCHGSERREVQLLLGYEACLEALASKAEPEAPLDVARTGRIRKQVSGLLGWATSRHSGHGVYLAAGWQVLTGEAGQQGQDSSANYSAHPEDPLTLARLLGSS
jgi:hypothetical protein